MCETFEWLIMGIQKVSALKNLFTAKVKVSTFHCEFSDLESLISIQ